MTVEQAISDAQSAISRMKIPAPVNIYKFIIQPNLWRFPNFKNLPALTRRIKTNLLYFQTNYLIMMLCIFSVFAFVFFKTLLGGFISVGLIIAAVLFFLEMIPLAREIKQNHPTAVIIVGLALVVLAWHAFHLILLITAAAMAPAPMLLLHASFRSTEAAKDSSHANDFYTNTPMGQLMLILGIEPKLVTGD